LKTNEKEGSLKGLAFDRLYLTADNGSSKFLSFMCILGLDEIDGSIKVEGYVPVP
jgi:hypothetical protein